MQKPWPPNQSQLQSFLSKSQPHLNPQLKSLYNQQSHSYNLTSIKSRIISDNNQHELGMACQLLKNGGLVSFPTETVYGLGADATNQKALRLIYQTKKRPLSDPIIVHVLNKQDAYGLVEITQKQLIYFQILTKYFWPGPLTIILKANLKQLPMVVTAQTGYVGIRCPNHPFFRRLLQKSGLPIGAPSANLFSHVSPTEAVHVFNDFWKDDVCIVDGGKCEFGIESTVLKITDTQIKVFRQGSLSVDKIQNYLDKQLGNSAPIVQIIKKTMKIQQNSQCPGQLLKHYSPNLPCSILPSSTLLQSLTPTQLSQLCLISFNSTQFTSLKEQVGKYYEIGQNTQNQQIKQNKQDFEDEKFCTIQEKKRMRQVYYLLRQAENLSLKQILIGWNLVREGTIWDKVFRATQGKQYQNHFSNH